MTTRTEGVRQSDRVSLRLPVEVTWHGATGAPLTHEAESLLVSRNGGVLRLPEKLLTGQEVFLRRQRGPDDWKAAHARIVAEIDHDPDGFLYAIAIRSRNPYPEGTRLEVAVPYTPGNSAIFVPIRIVSSRPIPTAGLFRHGAAYVSAPSD